MFTLSKIYMGLVRTGQGYGYIHSVNLSYGERVLKGLFYEHEGENLVGEPFTRRVKDANIKV